MPDSEAGRGAALLEWLRSPAAHAGAGSAPPAVETIETHMAWVFVAGDHAFKLKKPVRYPSLDYATPQAREVACREEVRLNRRLAPRIYDRVAAVQWRDGRFHLVPDPGPVPVASTVDWVVCMRRLPRDRMLDHAIADGRVPPGTIDALGAVLAAFYRAAPRLTLDPRDYPARLRRELAISREVLLRPQFQLDGAAAALDRLDRALQRDQAMLEERAAQGHVVDGHGDLRPEHICLLDPPVIIDALEFNPLLRQVDPFDELAFLGLECERAGAGWIGTQLIACCSAALNDVPPPTLLPLYTAGRALLRARLAMAHLLDPHPRLPQRWAPLAQQYVSMGTHALDVCDRLSAATRRDSP
jgi:uncharacterized protein